MSKHDFVIIGSGLGGLICGAVLSKAGYGVCIVEKNPQIGGNLQVFSRDKTIFDTGIHYIGGLDEGQNLYKYFKYIGIMDDLKLHKMDMEGFDIISFDNDPNEYKYAQTYEGFMEGILKFFPKERAALVKYCDKIQEVCASFPMYQLEHSANDVQPTTPKFLDVNAKEFIASCTDDVKLQNVLAGSNALYAGEGDKTPLYVHSLVTNTYIESSWRCVNGAAQIAILLKRIILNNGGKVMSRAEASKFHFQGNEISSVELQDGRLIEGKTFISNIHPAVTLSMIEEGKVRKAYKRRVQTLENSISVFILYIVLKPEAMPYFNHNYYHFKDWDVWGGANYDDETWPNSYALFTGITSKGDAYADGLIMMGYMHYDEVKKWEKTFNTTKERGYRGEDYDEFKKIKAEKMLDELEGKIPNIRSLIKSYYTSTPLTFRDYIGTLDGSMYGFTKDYRNPIKSFLSAKTKIPNLYLTGQNLNLHGVLGVTISAIVTCSEFLEKEKLIKDIAQS